MSRKPKFLSSYVESIGRKVLYTEPIFLLNVEYNKSGGKQNGKSLEKSAGKSLEKIAGKQQSNSIYKANKQLAHRSDYSSISILNRSIAKGSPVKIDVPIKTNLENYLRTVVPSNFNPTVIAYHGFRETPTDVIQSVFPDSKIGNNSEELTILEFCDDLQETLKKCKSKYILVYHYDADSISQTELITSTLKNFNLSVSGLCSQNELSKKINGAGALTLRNNILQEYCLLV